MLIVKQPTHNLGVVCLLIFQHSVSNADKLVHGRRDDLHFLFATLRHHRDYGRGEKEFEVSGSYVEICLPFWRALRSLQGRFSNEDLEVRWHRPFPWKEIDLLTKAIKERVF